ncbi:ABC transporter ATP-binding protein [Luteolibacter arcticus]|uniref:ABC transporter ATP-binding protein n=1 Tax=Luteolibacter arcticus TaxID=1581411 RepID=A0ABT3GP02_9BACT|nr:ABC transporter ATP-binding protein [Luteolibacter arcticus]MCW1925249.1 ABC transporter ATP-binding protein [Luteolibacter arcticus]
MPLLEAAGLGKRYGSKRVLWDVDLAFEPGEIVAVLGVNGAGKTTLLGCLAGMLGWDRGEVRMDGEKLNRDRLDQRQRMMFLPGEGFHFGGADTIRNAAIFSELWRGIDAKPPLDIEEWLERLGLLEVAFSSVETLSRGQRYKAVLLALHCADPDIWLIDEPFAAGMDARGMEAFRQLVRAAATRKRCIVYTTQFPELAVRFADRIVVVGGGGIHLNEPTRGRDLEELIRQLGRELGIQDEHS